MSLTTDQFIKQSFDGVILDVRTPSEYQQGHIPSAVNFPLFSDQERAEVGTIYVRESREKAIERGLEMVGPRLCQMVKEARELSQGKALYIYCWRGGMRSASVSWLLRTAGMEVHLLDGGYKAWRGALSTLLESRTWTLVLLSGMTGCGKTDILQQLTQMGEQVLDIEALAQHKGSAFGDLGMEPQPSTEHFGNLIHRKLRTFDPSRPIWTEDESKSVGKVFIPDPLWDQMLTGITFEYSIPLALRIQRLTQQYGNFDISLLVTAFKKIEKRLGYDHLKHALTLLREEKIEEAAQIALTYYDKFYINPKNRETRKAGLLFEAATDNPVSAAISMQEILHQHLLHHSLL